MQLSNELLSQFAKVTKDRSIKKQETIVYGTVVESNGEKYVRLDGSDILTPMATTTKIANGERVPAMIKNHMIIVTGNLTSPAIRTVDLTDAYSEISYELTIQEGMINSKASKDDFNALNEKIESNTSEISQTPEKIKTEVTEMITSVESNLQGQIDQNSSDIEDAKSDLDTTKDDLQAQITKNTSLIEQTATKIKTEVSESITSVESDLQDQIDQNGSDIDDLNAAKDDLQEQITKNSSSIEQTAIGIREEVTDHVNNLQGQIDLTSKQVEIAVGRTVGGTNMLKNTLILSTSNYVFDASGATAMGSCEEDNNGGFHIICKSSNLRWWLGHFPVTPGQQYSMSVRYRRTSGYSPIQFQYVWRGSDFSDIEYSDSASSGTTKNEDGWVCYSDIVTVPDNSAITQVRLAIRTGIDRALYTCEYNIKQPKFEKGNTPTDWSQHPEELQIGSSIKLTDDEVDITTKNYQVNILDDDGVTTMVTINESGATFQSAVAPDITPRYVGPSSITVNPNATSEQIATGGVYRSLIEACSTLNGQYLDKTIDITVSGDTYGDVELRGLIGGYPVNINGGGYSLIGTLNIVGCATRVYVSNISILRPATSSKDYAVNITSCRYVSLYPCVVDGAGATNALRLDCGTRAWIRSSEFYNAEHLVHALYGTDLTTLNIKGSGGTNFICTDGAVVKWNGSRPAGTWLKHNVSIVKPDELETLTIDEGISPSTSSAVGTTMFDFMYADSYCGGWSYFADDDVRQGFVSGRRIYGTIWFNVAKIRSAFGGKVVNQASLRLNMHKFVGRGVNVSIQLYGTNTVYSSRSGAPSLITSYGTIGGAKPGEVNEIVIPVQVITDIVNGTICALVLLSDDDSLYKDRAYSRNYARFDGSTSGESSTRPRLTIIGDAEGGDTDDTAVTFIDNGDGTVTLDGTTFIDNGDGTVTLDGAAFIDNGDGTITIE